MEIITMKKKKSIYNCIYIKSIWKMLQYINAYENGERRIYRSESFRKASRTLYFHWRIKFKDRLEVYRYVRRNLALNSKIRNYQYILYIIRYFFSILFTDKQMEISRDILAHIVKNYPGATNVNKINRGLGVDLEEIEEIGDKALFDYLEAKGYDVEYG